MSNSDDAKVVSYHFPKTAYAKYKPLVKAGEGVEGEVFLCGSRTKEVSSIVETVAVKVWYQPSHRSSTPGPAPVPKPSPETISALRQIKDAMDQDPCQHIVQMLELEHLEEVMPWYSMRTIRGCTLARYLEPYNQDAPLAMYFHVFGECLSAAIWLRDQGLTYQDFTEINIMFEVQDRKQLPHVVIIDLDSVKRDPDPENKSDLVGKRLVRLMEGITFYFPRDFPKAWIDGLEPPEVQRLEVLRTLEVYRNMEWNAKSALAFAAEVKTMVSAVQKFHDPQMIEEVGDVVEKLWSKTSTQISEMAKGDGMAITRTL